MASSGRHFSKVCAAGILGIFAFASTAESAEFQWRMQSNLSPGEPGYESAAQYFGEVLTEMSGGRIEIEIFPVGSLFPIEDGLQAVEQGIAEIGMMTGGYFAGRMGPIATLESGVPGAERDAFERQAFFYRAGFIDLAREAYAEHGVYYLGPHLSPQWDIVSTTPITSKDDFDGLRLRAFGIEAEWYESMGASTTMIDGGEIYTALSTGVVDAVRWGSPSQNHALALYEVGDYYVVPSPMPAPNNHFLVNETAWNSLPSDLQAILEQAAKLASLDYLQRAAELDAYAMAQMQEAGMEVSEIPEEEWAAMELEARDLWAAYAEEDELSARAVELLQNFLEDLGR